MLTRLAQPHPTILGTRTHNSPARRVHRQICTAARRVLALTAMTLGAITFAAAHPTDAAAQPVPPEQLVRRPLGADTVIDGVPCAKSGRAPAEFHKVNGRLAGCGLSRPFAVGAHQFPRDTWLDFNAAGTLWGAWLSTTTRLDQITCLGRGYKAWSVRFHSNGRLAGCYLADDTVIQGVPCMSGSFTREVRGHGKTALQLDEGGRVRRCQAARDTTVGGRAIRKWDVVVWDSGGRLVPR